MATTAATPCSINGCERDGLERIAEIEGEPVLFCEEDDAKRRSVNPAR